MLRFTQLFAELEATTRTAEKLAALERYFRSVPDADAAWALLFLSGQTLRRAVPTPYLRAWAAHEAGLPEWLVDECVEEVGDLGEALALVLPDRGSGTTLALHQLVEQRLLPLSELERDAQRELVVATWRELGTGQRLVWNKLITGAFRVGVSRTLVVRALSQVAGVPQAAMAHRVMGYSLATPEHYRRLLEPESAPSDELRPYPFFLAQPLQDDPATLGGVGEWQAEWKWDGIRAQLIARGAPQLWSRGEELVTQRFPDVLADAQRLGERAVLDGEVLAWRGESPLSFALLQQRIGRKNVDLKIQAEVPAAFMAFDLLEHAGEDVRARPLAERRARLRALVEALGSASRVRLSPEIAFDTWDELARERQKARTLGVEGVMIKRRDSLYGVGRTRGDWWKWKVDPYQIDAVLIHAQLGHGRRASLYTDYTFGVWHSGELVPIAKAYSGLTDEEIREVDQFVRRNIRERFGPVRAVAPELVFELHFEGIQESTRHKAGIAVRFPRIARWRKDKRAEEADTLETLRAMLKKSVERGSEVAPPD